MTKYLMVATLACTALTASVSTIASADPARVDWAFSTGYIPHGYDTNDSVQVVAEGVFPNTCFRPATAKVDVDHVKKTVVIHPAAYEYQGLCLQLLVPWSQELNVGMLQSGTYSVIQKGHEDPAEVLGEVKVRLAANSSPDDFLYAPISQAYYEKQGEKDVIKISGSFSNSCQKLLDTMVSVQPKVVVIQPVSEMQTGPDCKSGNFPFERSITIPGLEQQRYLLHVRSLNGHSVNTLFDAH